MDLGHHVALQLMIKDFCTKTARIFTLAVSTFVLFNCKIPTSAIQGFTGETIAFKWENIRVTETDYITKDDSVSIFRAKDYTIYRLPSYHYITNTILNKEGDVIDETSTKTSSFHYYVHKKGDDDALLYDSINSQSYSKRVLIDSMLIKHFF